MSQLSICPVSDPKNDCQIFIKTSENICRRTLERKMLPLPPWQVQYINDEPEGDSQERIPRRFRSEFSSHANGPIFILLSLTIVWILTLTFAFKFPHVLAGEFQIILFLQYGLWAVINLSLPIVSLFVFDWLHTRVWSRNGQLIPLSLYTLEAWMSLIIRPINILKGKFINIMFVILPLVLAGMQSYATDILGRETRFELISNGEMREIRIGPAGAGGPGNYVMTGQEFIYNASEGHVAAPNARFVFQLNDEQMIIPSLPDIGTYAGGTTDLRALKAKKINAVRATTSTRVESIRDFKAPTNINSSLPEIGAIDIRSVEKNNKNGTASLGVGIFLKISNVHRQIYLTLAYETVQADFTFATFNNGTQIYEVKNIQKVQDEIPDRLRGERSLRMDSVLENFIVSQNGRYLVENSDGENEAIKNLGSLLASSFGIRSATNQNFLDGMGPVQAEVLHERISFVVPKIYWILAGTVSGFIAIVCLLMLFIRVTLSGGLMQIVALLSSHISNCPGAGTPPWQMAYQKNKKIVGSFMGTYVMLGYARNKNDPSLKEVVSVKQDDEYYAAHRIQINTPKSVTNDSLQKLNPLLAV